MSIQEGSQRRNWTARRRESRSTRGRATILGVLSLIVLLCVSVPALAQVEVRHVMYAGHGAAFNDALADLAEQFNASRSDIRVVLEAGGGGNAYVEHIYTLIAGGLAPDVIHVAHNLGAAFAASGTLVDLNLLAARDGIELADLMPVQALEAVQWDGMQFGLPIFGQALTVAYNRQLFGERGVADPQELYQQGNWTWDTYLDAARRLTFDRSGDGQPDVFGTHIPTGMVRVPVWVWQAGGDLFDRVSNPTVATFATEEALTAFQYVVDMYKVHNVVGGNFPQGTQGMNPEAGPWVAGNWAAIDVDWDIVPLARGPVNNRTGLFLNNVQLIADSRNQAEAWEWAKFIALNLDSVEYFVTKSGRTPVLYEAFPHFLTAMDRPQNRNVWLDQLTNAQSVVNTHHWGEMAPLINQALQAVIRDEMPLRTALENAQHTANVILRGE